MASVSIDLFKKHVRADDFSDDDEILEQYLGAAEESVGKYLNRDITELSDGSGNLPKSVVQAILMLAAHWYNQRESVSAASMQEVPDTLGALLKPWRKLV